MNLFKKSLMLLAFSLSLFSCQSSRVIYKQYFGPNEKDEFAVIASFKKMFFFTLDCHDSVCEMRRCNDSTYSDCKDLLATCTNEELKLMFLKNAEGVMSEVRICKNYEETMKAEIKRLDMMIAKATGKNDVKNLQKSDFAGYIEKKDFQSALNDGFKFEVKAVATGMKPVVDPNVDVAACTYYGPGAADLTFEVDEDSKRIKLKSSQGRSYTGIQCTVPIAIKPGQLI